MGTGSKCGWCAKTTHIGLDCPQRPAEVGGPLSPEERASLYEPDLLRELIEARRLLREAHGAAVAASCDVLADRIRAFLDGETKVDD